MKTYIQSKNSKSRQIENNRTKVFPLKTKKNKRIINRDTLENQELILQQEQEKHFLDKDKKSTSSTDSSIFLHEWGDPHRQ